MVLVKKGNCSILFIFGKIGQENVFHDILQRKTSLKDIKNSNLKKTKNWDFSKGVSRWFWLKISNSSIFLF